MGTLNEGANREPETSRASVAPSGAGNSNADSAVHDVKASMAKLHETGEVIPGVADQFAILAEWERDLREMRILEISDGRLSRYPEFKDINDAIKHLTDDIRAKFISSQGADPLKSDQTYGVWKGLVTAIEVSMGELANLNKQREHMKKIKIELLRGEIDNLDAHDTDGDKQRWIESYMQGLVRDKLANKSVRDGDCVLFAAIINPKYSDGRQIISNSRLLLPSNEDDLLTYLTDQGYLPKTFDRASAKAALLAAREKTRIV